MSKKLGFVECSYCKWYRKQGGLPCAIHGSPKVSKNVPLLKKEWYSLVLVSSIDKEVDGNTRFKVLKYDDVVGAIKKARFRLCKNYTMEHEPCDCRNCRVLKEVFDGL